MGKAIDKNGVILTNFKDLDKKMSIIKNDFVVIGGRVSMGASPFLLKLFVEMVKEHKCSFISFQDNSDMLYSKMVALVCRITLEQCHAIHLKLSEDQANKMFELSKILDKNGEFQNENKIEEIRKHIIENKPKVVFIDSINTLDVDEDQASKLLKEMTNLYGVTIICTALVTSWVDRREYKRPYIGDLRNNEILSLVADKIILLYRDDYYNKQSEDMGLIELIIVKTQFESLGKVELRYFHQYLDFANYTRIE